MYQLLTPPQILAGGQTLLSYRQVFLSCTTEILMKQGGTHRKIELKIDLRANYNYQRWATKENHINC